MLGYCLYLHHDSPRLVKVYKLLKQTNTIWVSIILLIASEGIVLGQEVALKSKYSYSTPALEAAQALYSARKYAEALSAFEKIINEAERQQNYEEQVYAMEKKALALRKLNRYEEAIETMDESIELATSKLPKGHFLVAKAYHRRGTMDHSLGNYYNARSYFDTALVYYDAASKYDSSIYKSMVEYKFYAYQYSEGSQDTLLRYLKRLVALERIQSNGNPDPNLMLRYLQSYPTIYIQKGDFEQALAYAIEGYQYAMENSKRVSNRFLAESQFYLAQVLYHKRDFHKAIKLGLELMQIVEKTPRAQMPEYYSFNNLLGISYMAIGDYEQAILYLEKAAEVIDDKGDLVKSRSGSKFFALVLINTGLCYNFLGDREKAEDLLSQSLARMKKLVSLPNPALHRNYERLGDFFASHLDWDSALTSYDSAMRNGLVQYQGSVLSFPSNVRNASYSYSDLRVLMKKAGVLKEASDSMDNPVELLLASKEYVEKTHDLLSINREAFLDSEGKLFLSENFKRLYEIGVDVSFSLYKLTNDKEYFEAAMNFSRQSKAILFLEQSQEFDLVNSDLLSSEIKERFFKVRSEVESLQKAFYSLIDVSVKSDSVIRLNQELADVRLSRDKLKDSIQGILESYGEGLSNVKRMLKDAETINPSSDQAFIEFFYGERNIYVMSKTDNKVSFQKIFRDQELDKALDIVINMVSKPPNTEYINDEFKEFKDNSSLLYSRLLEKTFFTLGNNFKHLIIIPDEVLARLPFEVLVKNSKKASTGFHDLDYLVKSHSIQYELSSELIGNEKRNGELGEGLLGIGFKQSGKLNSKYDYATLPGTEREIKYLKASFSGTYLIGEKATKSQFLAAAKEFDILHLAVHGKADNVNRYESSLIFNGEGDNVLNTNDLYLAGLQARLAVLSACESGVGVVNKGEGVFSIARGFALVGVPSIVMSLWKVNDNTTSRLMTGMYTEFIEGGSNINESLRNAKLSYLNEGDEYSGHPYYWAAFLQLGDNTKYVSESNSNLSRWLYSALLVIIFCAFLTVLIKRKRAV